MTAQSGYDEREIRCIGREAEVKGMIFKNYIRFRVFMLFCVYDLFVIQKRRVVFGGTNGV